eukprot:scaffold2351_cov403-Prasinococcus_capsulatus_cf.AAC.3
MSSLVAVLGQGSYFAELRYGGGASSLRAVPGRGCVLPQPREQLGGTPDIVRLRKGRLAERDLLSTLSASQATVDTVVDLLLTILDGECGASNSGDVGGIHPSPAIGKVTRERAFLSLCALVAHDGTHFRLDPDRLQDIDEKLSSSYPSLILRNDSRANELSIIFDQEGRWHARRTGNQTEGTHHFAGVSAISGKGYCARVHDKGCVRFGPVRSSPEHAQSDHDLLQKSLAEGKLNQVLARLRMDPAYALANISRHAGEEQQPISHTKAKEDPESANKDGDAWNAWWGARHWDGKRGEPNGSGQARAEGSQRVKAAPVTSQDAWSLFE